jgi:hypothetical protein
VGFPLQAHDDIRKIHSQVLTLLDHILCRLAASQCSSACAAFVTFPSTQAAIKNNLLSSSVMVCVCVVPSACLALCIPASARLLMHAVVLDSSAAASGTVRR